MYYLGKRTASDTTFADMVSLINMLERNPDILANLRRKKYTVKDTDKSFRTINHWESVGLLDNERQDEKEKWRKFSQIDIVYLHLLSKLREFDLSLAKLKNAKHDLMKTVYPESKKNCVSFSVLEYAYCRSLGLKNHGNTYFMIDSEGHIDCTNEKDIILMRTIGELPDAYIYLNFNEFLQKLLKSDKQINIIRTEKTYVLDGKGEEKLIELMRLRDYNNISISLKNGENMMIECESPYNEGDDIPDYAEIVKQIQDSCVVRETVKEKIKIK
ncbi:MAG: MerR family transcriptional regulator [Alphaproteobacteria bacterium]|nr:MerR family transcriptional regulator [Alphaproteobacteria bacterium]